MTVSYQLKLAAVSLVFIVGLIASLMMYFDRQVWQSAISEAMNEILVEQATLVVRLEGLSADARVRLIDELAGVGDAAANNNTLLALLDEEYQAVAGHSWVSLDNSASVDFSEPIISITNVNGSFNEAFAVIEPIADGQSLLVGQWTAPYRARIHETWRTLILGGIVVAIPLILFAVLSQWRTHTALVRLQSVCEAVGGGDLDVRLPNDARTTELATVGRYLNQTFARLQDHVAGLSQLADSIQHEVAHGIARIDTRLQKLQSMLTTSDQDVDQCIADIKTECDAIAASATAMLALSEIKAGSTFAPRTTDLAQCAGDVLDTLAILAEDKGIELKSDLHSAPMTGDPHLLQVLISNLISNAIKYTPPGGRVWASVSQRDGLLQLVVEDSGLGIAREDREDVFIPRRRLTRDRETPGHGYGLAIAKAIVERHNGSIRIEDSEQGARFVVEFPATTESLEHGAAAS